MCNFYALIGGEKLEAKLKPKEQAQEEYDDSIAQGHTAFLLEQSILQKEKNTNLFYIRY